MALTTIAAASDRGDIVRLSFALREMVEWITTCAFALFHQDRDEPFFATHKREKPPAQKDTRTEAQDEIKRKGD